MRRYEFTSESVGIGHPDKVADQISDAILDAYISIDKNARVACETFVTTNTVIIGGEVSSTTHIDAVEVARQVIKEIGYDDPSLNFAYQTCNYINLIHEQSPDIARGVVKDEDIGAGDQGIMFGYACSETHELMPAPIYIAHRIMEGVSIILKNKMIMDYLRPDGKCQVTMLYEDGKPLHITKLLISLNHKEFHTSDDVMLAQIKKDVKEKLIPLIIEEYFPEIKPFFNSQYELLVNPTGRFVLGGPHADTGLTGRKIIVDSYGGVCAHGGGAFSGKDPTKVDRSAAYMARYIAKNIVSAGICEKILIQISYAIGISKPLSITADTFGTIHPALKSKGVTDTEIENFIKEFFDMRPGSIIYHLKLRNPIYRRTAVFGHFGRKYQCVNSHEDGYDNIGYIEYFTWEKTDKAHEIRNLFNLSHVEATT